LEILHWEIEQESGEKALYFGEEAEKALREQLISGKLKLSNRCRQYVNVLERIEEGKEQSGLKQEKEWKTLRDYADGMFSLQKLYNPAKADGKRVARITWMVVGGIVAIGWNMQVLLTAGAPPFIAFVWSVVLLLLIPTVIGFVFGSVVVGGIHGLRPFRVAFGTLGAVLIGALVGGIVGWTFGYLIGIIIGLTKKRVLEG
jgi:hypothetical protein